MKVTLLACIGLASFAQALEVHEWGTFTVLSGSNGMQVPWYAGNEDLAGLPEFVSKPMLGKSGFAKIRMETPVIYFYPEKEMGISVEVSFADGRISETFPHSSGEVGFDLETNMISAPGKWTGRLHPPTDRAALAEIPAIPDSIHSEPYGAAREVPDAWIFESDLKEIPGLQVQPHFPQMEKFIFYRGAGNADLPIYASMYGDSVTVLNNSENTIPTGVALRVRAGKASWVSVSKLAGRPSNGESAMNLSRITFPKPDRPLDEVESELAEVWKKALASEGLTPAEASAMVETWRKTWFRESGDRILTLVPQQVTDAMLPLKITPAPEKTTRVFVARFEMVSPEREEALVGLLNSSTSAGKEEFAKLNELELGRFGNGAMEVAFQLQKNRMSRKFHALKEFGENQKTSGR